MEFASTCMEACFWKSRFWNLRVSGYSRKLNIEMKTQIFELNRIFVSLDPEVGLLYPKSIQSIRYGIRFIGFLWTKYLLFLSHQGLGPGILRRAAILQSLFFTLIAISSFLHPCIGDFAFR